MNRFILITSVFVILFAIGTTWYLSEAEPMLPKQYENSAADPATFIEADRLEKIESFSQLRNKMFFWSYSYEWILYLLLLGWGVSHFIRNGAEKFSRRFLLQVVYFVTFLFLLVEVLQFPLHYYSYRISVEYGLSNQLLQSWLTDLLKGFLINLIMTIPIVWLFYFVVRKSPKKWWLTFWIATIPLLLFLMFIQPVVLDPVFNDFQPLQNEELKEKILSLAKDANIPAEQVFEVNMSEKTNALNAYVNGIGGTMRIVLWDTTLQKMTHDEILFIMAHEIGHFVMNHMVWMLVGSILGMLVFFYLLYYLACKIIKVNGNSWGIRSIGDIASLPLILLLISLWTFATSPISNGFARSSEHAADVYAIEMTQDEDAAIKAFQTLAIESLSEPNPPRLIKVFRYTHPTLVERIYFLEESKND